MANNAYSPTAGPGNRTRPYVSRVLFSRPGMLLLVFSALWAANLSPLGAAGAPEKQPAAPRVTGLTADAGKRITTVTIATSDPVAYLTHRPDPLTLLIDLRDVDARSALSTVLAAKGVVAGAVVENGIAADGTTVARVRIRL